MIVALRHIACSLPRARIAASKIAARTATTWVVSLVAALLWLGAPVPSLAAYTWAKTTATQAPLRWPAGAEIAWQADSAALAGQARAALVRWTAVRCDGQPLPLALAEGSPATVDPRIAQVDVADDWTVGSDVIAYTAVVHNAGTGEIRDFRMRLNGVSQQFCTDATACGGAEVHLPTTLAHEWGHVWGLAHSAATGALLFAERLPGEAVVGLPADDRRGVCALYAPGARPVVAAAGCALRGPQPSHRPPLGWLAVWGLLALILVGVRRFGAGRRPPASRRLRVAPGLIAPGLIVPALVVPALVVLALFVSAPAQAFVLARSGSGAHQRWYVNEVTYGIEANGLLGQGIDNATLQAAAARDFATWAAVQCDLCHDSRGAACAPVACASHPLGLSFRFIGFGPERPVLGCADGSTPGPTNPGCVLVGNGSQVVFIDTDWPHGSSVIATTVVAADEVTGRIADADILFNTQDKTFCVDGKACAMGDYDLDNTLTHEIGHLLGLDHSLDGDATMYGGAPPGEVSKRDLEPDDVAGICAAYRQAWTPEGCPAVKTGCCATTPPRLSGALPWWCLVLSAALMLLWRRFSGRKGRCPAPERSRCRR